MLKIKISDGPEADGMISPRKSSDNLTTKPKQTTSFVLSQFNLMLNFKDPKDDELYTVALRDLFYFPTFWPIMTVIIAFAFVFGNQREILHSISRGWVFVILYFVFALSTFILLMLFTLAQYAEYLDSPRAPRWVMNGSNYVLRRFLMGRLPDAILILSAIAQGFNFLTIAVGNMCSKCGNVFMIADCAGADDRNFPWHKVFFSYTIQLVLPIFLKSTHRHLSFLSMTVITGFLVIALTAGDYQYSNQLVFMIVAFHLSIFEFERYRMMSFLLGKEALNTEKSRQEKTKADAHAQLERRMNQALLQQILPAQVAKQLLSGNKVAPEQFEEVTIFFSDVVGFTNICAAVTPIQVVKMLNDLYTVMDYCTSHFPLYKVETIGDAYMVSLLFRFAAAVCMLTTLSSFYLLRQLVGGLPVRDAHHAQQIADFALLVQTAVQAVKSPVDGSPINIRIGT
jgi:class 3 adenylate cyclase